MWILMTTNIRSRAWGILGKSKRGVILKKSWCWYEEVKIKTIIKKDHALKIDSSFKNEEIRRFIKAKQEATTI